MKLTHETSIATFIQFIIASFFILITQLGSSVVGCFKDGSNCVLNLLTSIIFFIVASVVFGTIWLIGYMAQERRSRRMAQLLICAEGFIGLLAVFSLKLNLPSRNAPGLIASFVVMVFAAWIIMFAFRLIRAGGGRVVVNRPRQRRRPPTS
ncbi:MAG TPA: hypothetical protein VH234_00795 [Candidatus Saccharimonadales bacterium]|nr:hypothetical protein [Candidatus Saccharimonadales bacterium]